MRSRSRVALALACAVFIGADAAGSLRRQRSFGGPTAALEPMFGSHGRALDIMARKSTCPPTSYCKCWEAPSTCEGFGSDCACEKECEGDSHCQWWLPAPRCAGSNKPCGHDLVSSGATEPGASFGAACDPAALRRLGTDAEWFAQVCGRGAEAVCSDACKGAVNRLLDHAETCPGAAFLRPDALRAVRDTQNARGCERYAGASTGLAAVPPSQRSAYISGRASFSTGSAEPEPLPAHTSGPGGNMARVVAETQAAANKRADAIRAVAQAEREAAHTAEAQRVIEAAKAHLAEAEAQRAAAAAAAEAAAEEEAAPAGASEEELAAAAARVEAAKKALAEAEAAKEAAAAAKEAEAEAREEAAAAKEEQRVKRAEAGAVAREREEAAKAAEAELGAADREARAEAEAEAARARVDAAEADRLDEEARKARWAAAAATGAAEPREEKEEEEDDEGASSLDEAQAVYDRAMAAKGAREGEAAEEVEADAGPAKRDTVPIAVDEELDDDALAEQEALLREELEVESADRAARGELAAERAEESAEGHASTGGATGATGGADALAERLAEIEAQQEAEAAAREEEQAEKSDAALAAAEAKAAAREEEAARKVTEEEELKAREEEAARVSAAWHASGGTGATGATGGTDASETADADAGAATDAGPGAEAEAEAEAETEPDAAATGAEEEEVGAEVAKELQQHSGNEATEKVYEAGVFVDAACSVRVANIAVPSGGACETSADGTGSVRAEFADGDVTLAIHEGAGCHGHAGVITGKVGACLGVGAGEGGKASVHMMVTEAVSEGLSISIYPESTCSTTPLHHESRAAGACGVLPVGAVSYAVSGQEVVMSLFPDLHCAAQAMAAHTYPLDECTKLELEGLPAPVFARFETFSNDQVKQ